MIERKKEVAVKKGKVEANLCPAINKKVISLWCGACRSCIKQEQDLERKFTFVHCTLSQLPLKCNLEDSVCCEIMLEEIFLTQCNKCKYQVQETATEIICKVPGETDKTAMRLEWQRIQSEY